MKYEKEFQAFYNKYSRLYNSDKQSYQSSKYNPPYYNYIVQPHDKYKEPFIHASRFNNDYLTEKIGYEKQEKFPFHHFRMSTPLYKPQEVKTILQGKENIDQLEPKPQQNSSNQFSEAEKKHLDDYRKQKEHEDDQRARVYQPQHVGDYTVTPNITSRIDQSNHYYPNNNNNQRVFPSKDNLGYGLTPIQIKSINKHTLSINPYTDKDINIGSSNLRKNPIVYPLDVGKVESKKMYTQLPLFGAIGHEIIQS